uniref:Uncharacterized protein n=1 Tax=viral metagenome TaxID=1070528 RepID=A0A6C0BQE8_9ZZZZ
MTERTPQNVASELYEVVKSDSKLEPLFHGMEQNLYEALLYTAPEVVNYKGFGIITNFLIMHDPKFTPALRQQFKNVMQGQRRQEIKTTLNN